MGPEYFADPTIVMYEKLLLAMFLGVLIGTERAILAKQPAGMRTFGLVAMGACLFILCGNFVDTKYLGVVNFNPSHVAAAVVTGIGFLGAGLIIFRGDTLHGVTTAAGLWITAAIGIAVGFGIYEVAIFATLLTLVMFTGMWYVENRFRHWVTVPSEPPSAL
jgi:putative Mg2+ transporter-C (MgtC) family protein